MKVAGNRLKKWQEYIFIFFFFTFFYYRLVSLRLDLLLAAKLAYLPLSPGLPPSTVSFNNTWVKYAMNNCF
jgi:hypothetical protein